MPGNGGGVGFVVMGMGDSRSLPKAGSPGSVPRGRRDRNRDRGGTMRQDGRGALTRLARLARRVKRAGLLLAACLAVAAQAAERPDCTRPLSLALHDHGLLYSADTSTGIDKDVA